MASFSCCWWKEPGGPERLTLGGSATARQLHRLALALRAVEGVPPRELDGFDRCAAPAARKATAPVDLQLSLVFAGLPVEIDVGLVVEGGPSEADRFLGYFLHGSIQSPHFL